MNKLHYFTPNMDDLTFFYKIRLVHDAIRGHSFTFRNITPYVVLLCAHLTILMDDLPAVSKSGCLRQSSLLANASVLFVF